MTWGVEEVVDRVTNICYEEEGTLEEAEGIYKNGNSFSLKMTKWYMKIIWETGSRG